MNNNNERDVSYVRDKSDDLINKHCIVCDETISFRALKCNHCGSYQGFRRYFTLSNTFLSLIIALISVAGLTYDKIESFNRKPDFVVHELNRLEREIQITNMSNFPIFINNTFIITCNKKSYIGKFIYLDNKTIIPSLGHVNIKVPLVVNDESKTLYRIHNGIEIDTNGYCTIDISATGNHNQKSLTIPINTKLKNNES